MTREDWLNAAVVLLFEKHLKPLGYDMPGVIKVSVGFPTKFKSKGVEAIGQCWDTECSEGHFSEIFISPTISEALEVLEILLHEVAHSIVGVKEAHNANFKACAKKIGLIGKATATYASDELKAKLELWLKELPPYPHSKLTPIDKPRKERVKPPRIFCPKCDYEVKVAKEHKDKGLPTCPCKTLMIEEEQTPE
jgi:hypothetical protein